MYDLPLRGVLFRIDADGRKKVDRAEDPRLEFTLLPEDAGIYEFVGENAR